MKYLLDTNLLLWSVFQPELLPRRAKDYLLDSRYVFAFSPVSIWETGIKHAKYPDTFTAHPERLPWAVQSLRYSELLVSSQDAISASGLPLCHRDPFDRMLIAQARAHGMVLLTADRLLAAYRSDVEVV